MSFQATKIKKALDNTALAKKISVRHFLTITADHSQYYGFHGTHHGVGSTSADAVENLIEQLPEDTHEAIAIALHDILTEERDDLSMIGFSVYQKEPGAQVDIEWTELNGRRKIDSACRSQDRDSDGVLDCVVLDGDFLPDDCDVLKDAFRDAYENNETYFYASLDLDALKDHLLEVQAELAGIDIRDLYDVLGWLSCDMIIDSVVIDTESDLERQRCSITDELGDCRSFSIRLKDGRVSSHWALDQLVPALAWLAGYY